MWRLLAVIGAGLVSGTAVAQTTYTWDGGGGSGTWNTAANWAGDAVPVSGTSGRITLAGTTQTTTTQNLGNPFDLNRLTFAAGAGAFAVSGDPLRFGGIGAAIVLDTANAATINSALVLNSTVAIRGAGSDLMLGGPVSGAGGLRLNRTDSSATVTLTAANSFTGSVRVNGGTLSLGGSGAISSAGPLSVGRDGAVDLNNLGTNNTNRLGDASPVTLGGGFLTLIGNNAAASSETTGALTLAAGQSTIDVIPGTGAGAQFAFASLSGTGSGTVLFNATANNLGAAPGSGVANVQFGTSPTLIGGGGAAGTTSLSILAPALATNGPAGDAVTLVTHGANGIRPLTAAEFASVLASGTSTAANVRLTDTSVNVTANTARNSLVLASTETFVDIGAGSSLNLTSGALVSLGNGTVVTGAGTLAFGNRAYVTVEGGGNTTTIETSFAVAGNAGLVKSGSGTLVLASTATLGANAVFVNAGTLRVEAAAPLASAPVIRVAGGARLDATALPNGLALGSGQTLTGSGTVTGGLRVGSGATVAPTDGSGSGPGTLTVGSTAFQPGGAYPWRLNSTESGLHTQSSLSSVGTLDLTGLSAGNRFTVRVRTLTAENADGALGDFHSGTAYTWTLATYSGGITGFAAEKFTLDLTGFANSLDGGSFTVGQSGNQLVLAFTPVPEPVALLGVAALALALGQRLRPRRPH